MAGEPPVAIREFYNHIKSLDQESLDKYPGLIDPRNMRARDHNARPKAKRCEARSDALQRSYCDVQLACFDFVGKCVFCGVADRHIHGVRSPNVYEVEGFPGLYIYKRLVSNEHVPNGLIDQLLHGELVSRNTETNLHKDYHVTYPDVSDDDAPTSMFDPMASKLKMLPRLETSWVSFPISVREFVEKLRSFNVQLPTNIKKLIEGILSLQVDAGIAIISSTERSLDLRQESPDKGFFVDMSLDCDGVFVVGRESGPDEPIVQDTVLEPTPLPPSPPTQEPDESWQKWIVGLDDEVPEDNAETQQPEKEKDQQPEDDKSNGTGQHEAFVASGYHLAVIRLRHGDALLFSGESLHAWHGVAKVIEGTFTAWERDWPNWFGDRSYLQEWKGCMRGRRIDLFLR